MLHPYNLLSNEQVSKLEKAVKVKLDRLSSYSGGGDDTLLEYTMLIVRTKSKEQLTNDLNMFLEAVVSTQSTGVNQNLEVNCTCALSGDPAKTALCHTLTICCLSNKYQNWRKL
eukprot:TRINITY_DN2113_c0_g2_i9.p1 TRINITY_DN2113_c0_g2~~TRINITY_DN2113_c0_g2_i9.p1  ORF type:complete len:114 (-),score=20.06 TRINITY_DN2113_c0_g2_i9:222-563(-)